MKKLQRYLEKQLSSISYLLSKPAHTYRTITFHRLRVRIKKLHSLLRFLNYRFEDFKMKKIFRPFDQVFQQAGKVRELQLEQAKLKKYFSDNVLPKYTVEFKNEQIKAQKMFSSVLKETSPALSKKTKERLEPYIKKVNKRSIKNYIKSKKAEIRDILTHELAQNRKIHELRKQLKNLNYIQKSTGINNKTNLVPRIDIIADLLGKWHDYRVIVEHLDNIDTKKVRPREKLALEKIKINFTARSALLLARANSKLS